MIRCLRRHLEARCRERGCTLEQVRPCIVSEDGDRLVVDETHPAYPRAKPGLGDMVAAVLSAFGITEQRVSRLTGKPCGCKQRREAMNRVGRQFGIG